MWIPLTRGDIKYILLVLSFFRSVLTFVLVFSLPLPLGAGSFGIKIRVEEGQNFFFSFSVKDEDGNEWKFIHERLFLFGFLRLAGRFSFGSVFFCFVLSFSCD